MKIIDYGYLIPSLIVLFGFSLLLYIKVTQQSIRSLSITIYGSTTQTAILAYYIDKNIEKVFGSQNKKYLNITIVSPFDALTAEKIPKQTDKTLLTFCGVQNHLMNFLKDLDMRFQINEYGIYFSKIKDAKKNVESNLQIYQILQQYPIKSLFQYGLSHITAKNIFQQFQNHLQQFSKSRSFKNIKISSIYDLSMATSIQHLFTFEFNHNGIKYLSQTIGLDQQYIHDYIMPVIWGNYLHQPNSITTMLKLLPLYCTKNKFIGNSRAILIDQNQLHQKLISKLKYVHIDHVYNHHLQGFQLLRLKQGNQKEIELFEKSSQVAHKSPKSKEEYFIEATFLNTFVNQTKQQQEKEIEQKQDSLGYQKLQTNMLFIIEDYDMINKKQISYYKTIIDGKMKGDEKYPQYYTIYLTYQRKSNEQQSKNNKYIYSATRLCKQNCKNFNKNIYLLISKQKLTEKDLGIFQQHHIIYYKKYWLPKSQLPSNKKFQEIQNVFRVYDTQSISDSYEFKLTVLDQLAHTVIKQLVHL